MQVIPKHLKEKVYSVRKKDYITMLFILNVLQYYTVEGAVLIALVNS